jgi:small-conductance mechanosensitive channel
MKLAEEVAFTTERVLHEPVPVCRFVSLGDSSVDLELRIWISDPELGIGNVKSMLLLGLWDSYHDNGIEFPYPQRDIHLKTETPIQVMQVDRPQD